MTWTSAIILSRKYSLRPVAFMLPASGIEKEIAFLEIVETRSSSRIIMSAQWDCIGKQVFRAYVYIDPLRRDTSERLVASKTFISMTWISGRWDFASLANTYRDRRLPTRFVRAFYLSKRYLFSSIVRRKTVRIYWRLLHETPLPARCDTDWKL